MTHEKLKINKISGVYKTIYYNGSYLFLFGKRKSQSFEISWEFFH